MACRKSAIAVMSLMMAAVFGCASSRSTGTEGRSAHATVGTATVAASDTSAPAAPTSGPKVQEAAFNEDSDGARLVLSSDAPLLYTAYEPRPNLLVVDLPGCTLADGFVPPAATGALVSSVHIEPMTEMGKQLTRLTIAHREGLHYDVHTVGQGLAVTFDAAPETASAETAAPAATSSAPPSPAAAQPAPVVAEKLTPAVPRPRGSLPMRSRRFVSRRPIGKSQSLCWETERSLRETSSWAIRPESFSTCRGFATRSSGGWCRSRVASSLGFAFRSFRPHRIS